MILYHTTLKTNLKSIQKEGLIPSRIGIVYLSENPDSWWQGDKYITFEVNMDNCPHRLTTFNEPNLDEVLCWGSIEPDRIRLFERIRNA